MHLIFPLLQIGWPGHQMKSQDISSSDLKMGRSLKSRHETEGLSWLCLIQVRLDQSQKNWTTISNWCVKKCCKMLKDVDSQRFLGCTGFLRQVSPKSELKAVPGWPASRPQGDISFARINTLIMLHVINVINRCLWWLINVDGMQSWFHTANVPFDSIRIHDLSPPQWVEWYSETADQTEY